MDDKELKLIVEISRDGNVTQRDLSSRTNLSLGLVNLFLKRLIKRGYVKVTGLNTKKVQYFLTAKGFAEKATKSYLYIFKTIDMVKKIEKVIQSIVLDAYKQGERKFVLLGSGSLADLVDVSVKDMGLEGIFFVWSKNGQSVEKDAFILATDKHFKKLNGNKCVNLAEKLADAYWGVEKTSHED